MPVSYFVNEIPNPPIRNPKSEIRNSPQSPIDLLAVKRDNFLMNESQQQQIEQAVRTILQAVGENPDREGLIKTPARVARMYAELFSGLDEDPATHLDVHFNEQYDEMVVLRDIPFYSMCEHHLLPFMGKAHVAYLPDGKVVGLSKLARVVEAFARRPQLQERLTTQIADLLMDKLQAKGAAVIIEANHTCMTIRGVKKPGSVMVTSAMRGSFRKNLATRTEAMNLMTGGR
jgi:GTP cyclohydrolase I